MVIRTEHAPVDGEQMTNAGAAPGLPVAAGEPGAAVDAPPVPVSWPSPMPVTVSAAARIAAAAHPVRIRQRFDRGTGKRGGR